MQYRILRIAGNENRWQGPSGGRLGATGYGDYVKVHGFGHEDWNFDINFEEDGYLLGHSAAKPSKDLVGKIFGLILAIYENGRWYAVGYYDGAELIEATTPGRARLYKMAADLFSLSQNGELHGMYETRNFEEFCSTASDTLVHFNWKVPISGVRQARRKIPLPKEVIPKTERMSTPFNLDEASFIKIAALIDECSRPLVRTDEEEYAEGGTLYRLHRSHERNAALVRDFREQLENFACSICGFDFLVTYGNRGRNYIECHHTRPIASMKPNQKTKLADLIAVCSNCHRMLHRESPPMDPEILREIVLSKRQLLS